MLMPAMNLTSYGTVRDIEKWCKRDRRTLRRDRIDFDEFNPFLTGMMVRGVDRLNSLRDGDPKADIYRYNRTTIKSTMLVRGIKLYNRAIAASIGRMLDNAVPSPDNTGADEWILRRQLPQLRLRLCAGASELAAGAPAHARGDSRYGILVGEHHPFDARADRRRPQTRLRRGDVDRLRLRLPRRRGTSRRL